MELCFICDLMCSLLGAALAEFQSFLQEPVGLRGDMEEFPPVLSREEALRAKSAAKLKSNTSTKYQLLWDCLHGMHNSVERSLSILKMHSWVSGHQRESQLSVSACSEICSLSVLLCSPLQEMAPRMGRVGLDWTGRGCAH